MPSNARNKSRKKNRVEKACPDLNIENGEGFYAKIEKIIGGNRVLVKLHTGEEQIAIIMGRHKNKKWMRVGEYVLLNQYFEIQDVIRATHPKAVEANKYLKKLPGNEGIVFKDYSDGDGTDEEEEEEPDEEIKKMTMGSVEKTKKMLGRKEADKKRDLSRRGEKTFTDSNVLQSESLEINANKKSSADSDDIDIDAI